MNKALLIAGLAEKREYDNEFNADTWALYVPKTDLITELPTSILLVFILLTTAAATLMVRQKDVSGPEFPQATAIQKRGIVRETSSLRFEPT